MTYNYIFIYSMEDIKLRITTVIGGKVETMEVEEEANATIEQFLHNVGDVYGIKNIDLLSMYHIDDNVNLKEEVLDGKLCCYGR